MKQIYPTLALAINSGFCKFNFGAENLQIEKHVEMRNDVSKENFNIVGCTLYNVCTLDKVDFGLFT